MNNRSFVSALLLSLLVMSARAQHLRVAKIFGDHAVLQREVLIPIWGWSLKGDAITVTLGTVSVKTTANREGKWMATLPASAAGGPYVLSITSKTERLIFSDVMVGEVWLCSGQSNMEWQMRRSDGFVLEREDANKFSIRQFEVPKEVALSPRQDLSAGEWTASTPSTIGDFTAVGYFFAKELSQKLGVTIGLINATWGGSQLESWLSVDGMKSSVLFKSYADHFPKTWEEADRLKDLEVKTFAFGDGATIAGTPDWMAKHDREFFQQWHTCEAPASWDWKGKWTSFRGQGFMQHDVVLSESYARQNFDLRLGDKDGHVSVYINGELIKEIVLRGGERIPIPATAFKPGNNSLLLHISPQQAPSWYGLGLPGNKADIVLTNGEVNINLADDHWRLLPDFHGPYHYEIMNNSQGTIVFNAMINPLLPYGIRGIAWYQGEANSGRSADYRIAFPLLINDWRHHWNSTLPFLFVQLSSFGGQQDSNVGSEWAELREAQTMALSLPATGMAVTIDIGNPTDIHPTNKRDVGQRLAANALTKIYGLAIHYSGPMFKSKTFIDGAAQIEFEYSESGLMVKDRYGYLKGFEIAGVDKKFHYAKAVIEGRHVRVWSEEVPLPMAVRYAWTDAPVEANLFNNDGFPANPFRTDNWKGITEESHFCDDRVISAWSRH